MSDIHTFTPAFTPYSDIGISDAEIITAHQSLLKQQQYDAAVDAVQGNAAMNRKGLRASFFNGIEQRIKQLQVHLLNKTAASDELYSLTEPTENQMDGKLFWLKPTE